MEKVEIEIRYKYDPSVSQPCNVRLEACLPSESGGVVKWVFREPNTVEAQLPEREGEQGLKWVFRDPNTYFFGDWLEKDWGIYNNELKCRYYAAYLSAESWEKLEQKISEYVESELEKLAKVVQKNYERLSKKPADRKEVYYLLPEGLIKKEEEGE